MALNNSGGMGLLGLNERLKSTNAKLKHIVSENLNVFKITIEL